jgi:hypothetical protein
MEASSLAVPNAYPQSRQIILFQNNVISTSFTHMHTHLRQKEMQVTPEWLRIRDTRPSPTTENPYLTSVKSYLRPSLTDACSLLTLFFLFKKIKL